MYQVPRPMIHFRSIFIGLLILPNVLLGQNTKLKSSMYLQQEPPGLLPAVFAPNLISLKDHYEYGAVFSKDGMEFYYAVIINDKPQIRYSRLVDNNWTTPKTVIGSDRYEYNDPFLSSDEKRLFFISDQAKDRKSEKKDFDI